MSDTLFAASATPPAPVDTTVKKLSPAAIEHRQEFRRYIQEDADPWHREHLGRLYDLWEEWNQTHFESRMVLPYILLSEPKLPRRYGDCGRVSGFGGQSQIRLRPSLLNGTHPNVQPGARFAEGRFRLVADILLHEMIHQWHQEITGQNEESYHGHGPAFRDVCNRIGATLGLPPVRTCKARGKEKDMPSCSYWPHIIRPDDYYLGAHVPHVTTSEDKDAIAKAHHRLHEARRSYAAILWQHKGKMPRAAEDAITKALAELASSAEDLTLLEAERMS